jgi:hypothetical protein
LNPEVETKLKAGQLDAAVELFGQVLELSYYIICYRALFFDYLESQNMKVMI